LCGLRAARTILLQQQPCQSAIRDLLFAIHDLPAEENGTGGGKSTTGNPKGWDRTSFCGVRILYGSTDFLTALADPLWMVDFG